MKKKSINILILVIILVLSSFTSVGFIQHGDRKGITLCNVNYDCGVNDDLVCPGVYDDYSSSPIKEGSSWVCKFDDKQCCVGAAEGGVDWKAKKPGKGPLADGKYSDKIVWMETDKELLGNAVDSNHRCCGNAPNEFVILPNPVSLSKITPDQACCDVATDCVMDGVCYEDVWNDALAGLDETLCDIESGGTNCPSLEGVKYGCKNTVWQAFETLPLIPGELTISVKQEISAGGATIPSSGAAVSLSATSMDPLNNVLKTVEIDSQTTDNSGVIILNTGGHDEVLVSVKKAGFTGMTEEFKVTENPNTNFVLKLSTECQSDCTRNDKVCHAECFGINGCTWDTAVYGTEKNYICDSGKVQMGKGWEIFAAIKGTTGQPIKKKVYCCNKNQYNDVVSKQEPAAIPVQNIKTSDMGAGNVQTYSRLAVGPDGRPIIVYISVWDPYG